MTDRERLREANRRRNMGEANYAAYKALPHFDQLSQPVRCPGPKFLGPKVDDIVGCDGTNVIYDGDVYDCLDCGIFFTDLAANPPHQRGDL